MSNPKTIESVEKEARRAVWDAVKHDDVIPSHLSEMTFAYKHLENQLSELRVTFSVAYHQARTMHLESERLNSCLVLDSKKSERNLDEIDKYYWQHNMSLFSAQRDALSAIGVSSAVSLVIGIDSRLRSFSKEAFHNEWFLKGGPTFGGTVDLIELFHRVGNWIRHRGLWPESMSGPEFNQKQAKENIKALAVSGLSWESDRLPAEFVKRLPYRTYIGLELSILNLVHRACWIDQEKTIRDFATAKGMSYKSSDPPLKVRSRHALVTDRRFLQPRLLV
jgi:hypothetical protein